MISIFGERFQTLKSLTKSQRKFLDSYDSYLDTRNEKKFDKVLKEALGNFSTEVKNEVFRGWFMSGDDVNTFDQFVVIVALFESGNFTEPQRLQMAKKLGEFMHPYIELRNKGFYN